MCHNAGAEFVTRNHLVIFPRVQMTSAGHYSFLYRIEVMLPSSSSAGFPSPFMIHIRRLVIPTFHFHYRIFHLWHVVCTLHSFLLSCLPLVNYAFPGHLSLNIFHFTPFLQGSLLICIKLISMDLCHNNGTIHF